MARIAGHSGSVSIAGAVNGVTKWSITYEADVLETTGMDSAGVAAYIGGITRWSGSVTAHQDAAGAKSMEDWTPGSIVAVSLVAGSGGTTWAGQAVIKSVAPEVSMDGTVDYTVDFQGTGALSIT